MMTSGPAGESEVLSLLQVIADPEKTKERLKQLAEQTAALAAQEAAFNASAAETTARIKEQQDKADRDAAMAEANLNAANKLLEANQAKERDLTAQATAVDDRRAEITGRELSFETLKAAANRALDDRDDDLAEKEAALAAALAQAEASAAAAISLKSELETKLARLREITGA